MELGSWSDSPYDVHHNFDLSKHIPVGLCRFVFTSHEKYYIKTNCVLLW